MTTTRRQGRPASTSRIVLTRARSRAGLLAGIAAAIALSLGLVCGVFAATSLETAAAVRAAMPAPDSPAGWLQVQTRPAAAAATQDAAAAEFFQELFGDTVVVERLELGEPGSDLERVAWRVTPDAQAVDPESVERLAHALAELPTAFRQSDAAQNGSLASGGLAVTVATVAQGVRAAAAMAPVPLAILAVLAWFAVLQLARLLGMSRGRESVLLRARGLSAPQSIPLAIGESVAVTLVGAVVGLGAAAAWLAIAWGTAGTAELLSVWPLALGGIAALGATLTAGQLRAARAAERSESAAGRIARAASPGAAVLLVLIAALLIWQAAGPAGDQWTVALAALAPTVGVAAVAVLAVLLFGPLSAVVARIAARRPRVTPGYPARQVARRLASFSVAIALVTIAVSGAALAGSYAATWHATSDSSARLQAGAPLRAAVDPVGPDDIAAAASVPGVVAASPALTTEITAGDVAGSLVVLPGGAMGDVLFDVAGAADPDDLADALAADSGAAALPEGAETLRVTAHVSGGDLQTVAETTVSAWLMDESGLPLLVSLPVAAAPAEAGGIDIVATGDVPAGRWAVVAVEFARAPAGADLLFTEIAIDAVVGGVAEPLGVDPTGQLRLTTGGAGGAVMSALVWSAGGADPPRLPVAATSAFAEPLGLAVGDIMDIGFAGSGRTVGVEVRSIADALPGLGVRPGVLGPLAALTENQLPSQVRTGSPAATPPRPNEIWAGGDEGAAASLSDALDAPVSTPADPTAPVTQWVVATWNTAAVGGALLAGVALVALLTALTSQRAGEVLVLRAFGIPAPAQSRMRALESALVVSLAGVLGVAGGMLLAAFVVPGLVARAVPGVQLPPALALDPWPVAITALVVAVAWAGAAAGAALAVRRQAASTRLEEAAA